MNLGTRIKELRKTAEITQEEFAERMGVSSVAVCKWENNQCAPTIDNIIEIAGFFGVSTDYLLDYSIQGRVRDCLVEEIKKLNGDEEGISRIENILLKYPNDYEILIAASEYYYKNYITEKKDKYLDKAIELTQKMKAMNIENDSRISLDLYSRLGNLCELKGRYQKAIEYYSLGNVGDTNDSSIARCRAAGGDSSGAIDALSSRIIQIVFELFADCVQLKSVWIEKGEIQKALSTMQWLEQLILGLFGIKSHNGNRLLIYIYGFMALLYEKCACFEKADECILNALNLKYECSDYEEAEDFPFVCALDGLQIVSNETDCNCILLSVLETELPLSERLINNLKKEITFK